MITVHHLNDSRSQRVLWLLEELSVPYEIKHYQRNAQTRLAPPELIAVHPLGKSPVITDDGNDGSITVFESGAIIDYLIRHHGSGSLQPATHTRAFEVYQQWMHYAEGSAMLPLLLKLYVSRLGEAGAPLSPRIEGEIANHLGFVNQSLQGKEWLVGSAITSADIQMSFVGEVAGARGNRERYPNIEAWVARFQARAAYRKAIERGGPYAYGGAASVK